MAGLSTAGAMRVISAMVATGGWMFVSSYLILLNRHIMVDLGFKYPMTLSGFGMICSGLLSFLACRVFRLVECKASISLQFWSSKMLPVGFFMAVTLWTGNHVYLYLSVAFIQMFKAFTPVITMACLFIAGLEDPTYKMIAAVMITAFGTAMAAYGELNLSMLGLVLNLASGVSESIRLVMTQWLLTGLKFHPIEGLMYLAPACSVWLYAGASVLEMREINKASALYIIWQHPWQFAAAGVLGFMVNVLAYTSIKLASSLTLKVLGTVKNTLLAVWTVLFMGEVVTGIQAVGYTVSLFGFAWYNQIKMKQIARDGETEKKGMTDEQLRNLKAFDSPDLKQPLITINGVNGRSDHSVLIGRAESDKLLSRSETTRNPLHSMTMSNPEADRRV